MGDQLALSSIEGFERMVLAGLAYEGRTLAAHAAGNAAKTGSDVAAATTSGAVKRSEGLKEVHVDAKGAAAGAFKAVAGIPIIGPALAPVAAGAAFAGVLALAAFEQGGIVGGPAGAPVVVQAHAGERVLTTKQTNQFHSLLDQSSSRGGDMTVNFNGSHNFGSNGGDFKSQWAAHENHIVTSLRGLHRSNKLAFLKE